MNISIRINPSSGKCKLKMVTSSLLPPIRAILRGATETSLDWSQQGEYFLFKAKWDFWTIRSWKLRHLSLIFSCWPLGLVFHQRIIDSSSPLFINVKLQKAFFFTSSLILLFISLSIKIFSPEPGCNKPSDDNIWSIKIYEHFIAGANIQISS